MQYCFKKKSYSGDTNINNLFAMHYCLHKAHEILSFQVLSLLLQFSRGLCRVLRQTIKGKSLDRLKFNESRRKRDRFSLTYFSVLLLIAKNPAWPSTHNESISFNFNLRALSLMFYIRLTSNSIITSPPSSFSLPSFSPPRSCLVFPAGLQTPQNHIRSF